MLKMIYILNRIISAVVYLINFDFLLSQLITTISRPARTCYISNTDKITSHILPKQNRENEEAEVCSCLLVIKEKRATRNMVFLSLSLSLLLYVFIIHNHNKYSTRLILLSCNRYQLRSFPYWLYIFSHLSTLFFFIIIFGLLPHATFR